MHARFNEKKAANQAAFFTSSMLASFVD